MKGKDIIPMWLCTDTSAQSHTVTHCAVRVYLSFLICLFVPILLCFLGQLRHLPYSFWR